MRLPDFVWRLQDPLRKHPDQKISERLKKDIQSGKEMIAVVIITPHLDDGDHLPARLEEELRSKFGLKRLRVRSGSELIAALTPPQIQFVIRKGYVNKILTTEEYLDLIEANKRSFLSEKGRLEDLDKSIEAYRRQFDI